MSNAELIAEARARHYRLDGETNVCACDDDDWPCVTKQLADALAEQAATIEAVKAAYLNPGSHPEYHYQEKARLSRAWPTLAKAVGAL